LQLNNTSSVAGLSLVSSEMYMKMAKESFSLFGTRADLDELVLPNNNNGPSTVNYFNLNFKKLNIILFMIKGITIA